MEVINKSQKYTSISISEVIILLISNLYIIFCVFEYDWNGRMVYFSFLLELAIIFIFTMIKMIFAKNLNDPYFSKLNPHLLKNKSSTQLLNLIAMIIIFTGLMLVFGGFFSLNYIKNDIGGQYIELLYFGLSVLLSNLVGMFYFFFKNERDKAFSSEIFRNYMTTKILPIFISLYFMNYLFTDSNLFVIIFICLKFMVVLWTFGNERWIKYNSN